MDDGRDWLGGLRAVAMALEVTELRALLLTVAYDGTDYAGFQIQENGRTIQGEIERNLQKLTSEPIRITGAGRTDAGVHARGQALGFRTASAHSPETFAKALNAMLPSDIAVTAAEEAPVEFHARFWAVGKTYTYDIWTGRTRPVFERRYVYHYPHPLDIGHMREAAHVLIGRNDFASFQAAGSSAGTSVREIRHLVIEERESGVRLSVEADGFLYNMVRIIAGTLILIGRGKLSADQMRVILDARDRGHAGPTAPPEGLLLDKVHYRRESGRIIDPHLRGPRTRDLRDDK